MRAFPLLAILPALALAACDEAATRTADKPDAGRPVLAVKVAYEPATPERRFVATVRPRHESDLSFRIAGKAAKRFVDVGQRVAAGEALAALDDSDLQLQREQAEAELKAATAALAQAKAEMGRVTELRQRGWSTEQAADARRAAFEEAQGRLSRAGRAVALAGNALDYAVLRADSGGVVTAASVEPGQVLSPGQPAIRVARTAEREALIAVPESLVERVRAGRATVTLWAAPDRVYEAKLRELSPAADPATRTYAARFSIEGAGEEAQWGMTATVAISEKDNARVAKLPLSALVNEGKGPMLYVVDRSTGALTKKPVLVRRFDAEKVWIASGVGEGESVVALGVQKLDPSQKVRVVENLAF